MVNVERSRMLKVAPETVWAAIGDFHGMHRWHPGIDDCGPVEGDTGRRALVLTADSGTILEKRTGEGDLHYSYRIDEGPLPVSGYNSALMARASGDGGCEVVWSAEFEADGVSEEDAELMLGGVFETGLENIDQLV